MTLLKKYVRTTFLKCPMCGKQYASLIASPIQGGAYEWICNHCQFKTEKFEDFRKVKKRVVALKCLNCDNFIEDTSENWNLFNIFREVVCPECLLTIAINGEHLTELEKITQKDLNTSEGVNDNLYLFPVKTQRQKILLRILNIAAKKEDETFKNLPRPISENSDSHQYVLLSAEKLIGYLAFIPNWEDSPLLNQIYIVPEERRKGYARKLVQYFIEKNCNPSSETLFSVESPNEASHMLLFNKMGLDKEKVRIICLG